MGVWEQLEEKWRSSPQIVVLVFLCAVVVVIISVFAAFSLRKRKLNTHSEQPEVSGGVNDTTAVPCCCMVKPNLRSSILNSWSLNAEEEQKCEAMPAREGGENPAASPVWQRRILMGERCEMPRYSGLILYDERGRPVGSCNPDHPFFPRQGRKGGAASSPAKTTLRDLL